MKAPKWMATKLNNQNSSIDIIKFCLFLIICVLFCIIFSNTNNNRGLRGSL